MTTGLSDNIQEIDDTRKTAVIDTELLRLDIAAFQETRLAESGTLREKSYTFIWQGKSAEETREHGVGFAIRNTLMSSTEPGVDGTERILSLRLHTTEGMVNLVSVYAPTLYAPQEIKDTFYDQLQRVIENIPHQEQLILLGDFNARVGSDHESWPICLGKFGVGNLNENGQRLLELCTQNNLCVTNTFYQTKPQHKVSWRHPRSKRWHQLDLIISRRCHLKNVLITRSFQSADCNTDHSLVCSKIRLRPKKVHHARPPGKVRINTSETKHPSKVEEFTTTLEEVLTARQPEENANHRWNHLRDTLHTTALQVFGRQQGKSQDWFETYSGELSAVMENKRLALLKHKQRPTRYTLQALQTARSKAQKTARRCANDYWLQLCEDIQTAADKGNIRGVYDGIKKATCPILQKTAPLKSTTGETIKDKGKQMERWVEHYTNLYSRENTISDEVMDAILSLPLMEELDELPTLEEVGKAIDGLNPGKAPGLDGIPPEVVKCAKGPMLHHLHELLCQCWEEGAVPQDMRDCKIVTLYKNKGDRSDCNNYRGISLLSIVGKVFARVLLNRLHKLAERVYPESQCGFRSERSTIDMIFSLRQLQEKCREQRKPLYIAFIDLTKAFDLVSRDGLFKILHKIGCPPKLLSMIQSFHTDMKGTVQFNGASSDTFDIRSGVKQGCVLAPTLFGIFFAVMLRYAFGQSTEGVCLHTRSDGRLFNLARLRAKTKVRQVLIRDMLFADDAALVAHSQEQLQRLIDQFSRACTDFSLTISLKKTNVMGQGVENPPSISISDYELEAVHQFTYLGSTITDNLCLDPEIGRRIGRAATTFAKLTQRVWRNNKLTVHTKMNVYSACVLSTLLYGSESWTLYSRQERRLNTFHMRNLRRILDIKWQDHITNEEVLSRAQMPSLYTMLQQRRLRWLGHVHRMADGRIPKDLLYGELATGSRAPGRPNLRFKDVCKRDMKSMGIDIESWEECADNRALWSQEVRKGTKKREAALNQAAAEKRERRRTSQTATAGDSAFKCNRCQRDCRSRVGLYSHTKRCSGGVP